MLPARALAATVLAASLAIAHPQPVQAQAATPDRAPYRIDFAQLFYTSPAAEVADRAALSTLADSLALALPTISRSAVALERGLRLADRVAVALRRHEVYLHLRAATNTLDVASGRAEDSLVATIDARSHGVEAALTSVDSVTFERYVVERPSLAAYRFAVATAHRAGPRTLSRSADSAVRTLDPLVTGWQRSLYQRLLDRTTWPTINSAGGPIDVYRQRGAVNNDPDRAVRAAGRRALDSALATQRDLYAFALVETVRARNALARERGFANAPAQAYASRYLTTDSVRALIARIRDRAAVVKRFQMMRASATPTFAPRISIDSATSLMRLALRPLGDDYAQELALLLDPANGRLDLGPGLHRRPGGFSWDNPGVTTGVYLTGFEGYLSDLSRLTHETGHAMHRRLMQIADVPQVYANGPLLAEPPAEFNELLVADYVARTATDPRLKSAALALFIAKALDPIIGAQDADLEQQVYDSVGAGSVTTADDFDRLTRRLDAVYSASAPPDSGGGRWMLVSLLFEDPLYLSNYLYSGLLSVTYFVRYQRDPSRFIPGYLALLRAGYSAPPAALLQRYLDIDLGDPALVSDDFALIEQKMAELQKLQSEVR
jgi:oligoendopeptidase F